VLDEDGDRRSRRQSRHRQEQRGQSHGPRILFVRGPGRAIEPSVARPLPLTSREAMPCPPPVSRAIRFIPCSSGFRSAC
jgi:hypothetical protein